jgi:poly(3-hydroxybutyrate) depolymerase
MDFLYLLFVSLMVSLSEQHVQARASPGCGKPYLIKGITVPRFGLKSSGKDRSYMYHIPSSYDANKPYPVVVGFHGSSSIGTFFELDSKMSEGRFSEDKIMVYPNGIEGSWAGPSYHTGSTVEEDVRFLEDLIEDLKGKTCVDETKIYATG